MAYIQTMTIYACFLTLFTYEMLFGEGRQIKSPPSGVRITYILSPSPTGIRKQGNRLTAKSDHSGISPKKSAPETSSIDYPQTLVDQNNFASLEPTRSTTRRNLVVGSFKAKKERRDRTSNSNNSRNQITETTKSEFTIKESEDDYRRTSPGRSPGAGHAHEEDNREPNPKTAEQKAKFINQYNP